MRVTFVTTNPGKYREIAEIFRPMDIRVSWHRQALPEPQARSLTEVVRVKLEHVPKRFDPVLVEDSGLFLSGLRGFPGVYSRYVYETVGVAGVLRLLEGRGRRAVFRTVAGLRVGRTVRIAQGKVSGLIAARPHGSHGFGYDPVFIPSGTRRTYAQMSAEEKNRNSHRARAMRAVARRLLTG